MAHVPYVTEQSSSGERTYDVYSRLLKDRIVILGSVVTDEVANAIVAQMLFLEVNDPNRDIHLYINSPGGSLSAGLAIYDIMQFLKCDVATYCFGQACSMGSMLLTAGAAGKRFAMPNARVMIHQPHLGDGKLGGQVTDIEIHARELVKTKEKVTEIYARHSGQEVADLARMMERDLYLSAEEAKTLGLIDGVVALRKNKLATAG